MLTSRTISATPIATPASLISPSGTINARCSSTRATAAPTSTSGEAYLIVHNLAKAEEHLAALQKICLIPCEEYRRPEEENRGVPRQDWQVTPRMVGEKSVAPALWRHGCTLQRRTAGASTGRPHGHARPQNNSRFDIFV